MRREQVLATQIADHAVIWATITPVGFDETDVFVNSTIGTFDSGGMESMEMVTGKRTRLLGRR